MPAGSPIGLDVVATTDDPFAVFELVSGYGTVGMSLGIPTVGLHTVYCWASSPGPYGQIMRYVGPSTRYSISSSALAMLRGCLTILERAQKLLVRFIPDLHCI